MKAVARQCFISCVAPIWWLASLIVPKRSDYIAINSFPDFDDTVRSVRTEALDAGKTVVVLTTDKNAKAPKWSVGARIKVAYRYSIWGVWLYHRSGYVLLTHGLFSFWKPGPKQKVINVWHGMPIKNIGLLDGKKQRDIEQFTYTIAYNSRFRTVMAKVFGVPEEKVLISAHPRIDGMRPDTRLDGLPLPPHKYLAIWLPTYRQSTRGDVRVDGNIGKDIFTSNLSSIDNVFRANDCVCLVKPHPMSKATRDTLTLYSNIIYVDDSIMRNFDTTLYQLLGQSDFLITDVSSVYFDYQFMDRPTIIYCPDFCEYKTSRGFVAPIDTLIQEEIVVDEDRYIEKLKELFPKLPIPKPGWKDPALSGGITKALLKMVGAV